MGGFDGFTRIGIGIGRPPKPKDCHDRGIIGRFLNEKFADEEFDIIKNEVFPRIYKFHIEGLNINADKHRIYPE